jgi:dGTPase
MDGITRGYNPEDLERFVAEDRSKSTNRGEFARDRARVLHSSALRRLGAKTQVLSPGNGDFARTRLTHSLEVAQVGREMAAELGLDPDVVDTACLAHDLGHPPFGHNGEKALNIWANDFGGFEGNAQTLRLLSRIEPKVFDETGNSRGLNLTRASLDASCKYPWDRSTGVRDQGGDQSLKFGYYDDDAEVFEWLRRGASDKRKCLEAEVMDFADDVAYSIHDFEDAVVGGFINLEELNDSAHLPDLTKKIITWSGGAVSEPEVIEALARLKSSTYWLTSYDGTVRAQGTLKNLSSLLIGSLVRKSTDATIEASDSVVLVRYQGSLVVPSQVKAEIAVLKGITSAFLMTHETRRPFYEWQRAILTELADALLSLNGEGLDSYCQLSWSKAKDEREKYRVILDQVACLTDLSALNLHNKLVGSRS